MAIIYTYPVKTTPADADLILISDSESNNPKDKTKQITVESIKGLTAGVTKIIAGTNVTISPTSGVGDVTVNASGGGGGDTYTLQAEAKAGSSVPLKLDAATGTDSTVNLTEGTNVTITRNSATEVTIQSEDTTYAAMTNAALGLGKLRYTRGSTPAAESQTETASRTYGITDNASNQLVVNVPWTDTNTTDINLTTTGTSGAATWTSGTNTLNIPQYASSTPAAGSSGQIQYNNGSNGFTASAGLTYSTGSSLNTLVVGAQGSVPGVLEVKGADTTVGRLRLYCPDSGTPHYFELMGPDHSGAATYSVQVPEASPGGTEKILSVSTWNSGTSKADLAWVDLPTDTNTNIANANLTLNSARTLDLSTYNFQVNGSNVLRLSNANADPAKVALRVDNNVKVAGQAYIDLDALGNAGTSREIDWNDSNIQSMTLNGNLTISALSNGNPGGCYILVVTQPAGQAYTISWPSTVDWHNNNTAPGTITADRTDVYTFICRTTTSFLGTYAEDFII